MSQQNKSGRDNAPKMAQTFAPYNFVPHAKTVLLPDDAEIVAASQDVPHPDGMCGHLELDLLVDNLLLVAGQQKLGADGIKETCFFRTPDGLPAIPGSSLRGMIANVLKIALFGKLNQVDDVRLAMRDLSKGAKGVYQSFFAGGNENQKTPLFHTKTKTGWLSFVDGHWQLQACEVARVERLPRVGAHSVGDDNLYAWLEDKNAQPLLEPDFKTLLASSFGREFYKFDHNKWEAMQDKSRPDAQFLLPLKKTTEQVYVWWGKWAAFHQIKSFPLIPIRFTPGADVPHQHKDKKLQYRKATQLGTGNTRGTLVLTGHMGTAKHGKHMEFIFYDAPQATPPMIVPDADFFAFRQANETSAAWKFWMDKLKSRKINRIPVFYLPAQVPDRAQSGPQFWLGFTQLFKLPMLYSMHQALANTTAEHLNPRPDYVELLFGRLHGQAQDVPTASQWQGKGRVDFSLARLDPEHADFVEVCHPILPGAPKPTYYPNYVRQSLSAEQKALCIRLGKFEMLTLLHQGAQLRGWKRYQAKLPDQAMFTDIKNKASQLDRSQQQKQISKLHFIAPRNIQNNTQAPLRFKLRVNFHNVTPFELGALLWALTFGGDASKFHALGMGKAYGAGAVRFALTKITWRENRHVAQGFVSECGDNLQQTSTTVQNWQQQFMRRMDQLLANSAHDGAEKALPWQQRTQIQSLLALATRQNTQLERWRYMALEMRGKNDFQMAKNDGASLPLVGMDGGKGE